MIDHLISFNSIPQINQQVYVQQAIQTYREMQEINNAKNLNLMREQTVVSLNQSGTENQILNNYKAQEKIKMVQKNESVKKDTYEISFTNFRQKKNYNQGIILDLIV